MGKTNFCLETTAKLITSLDKDVYLPALRILGNVMSSNENELITKVIRNGNVVEGLVTVLERFEKQHNVITRFY